MLIRPCSSPKYLGVFVLVALLALFVFFRDYLPYAARNHSTTFVPSNASAKPSQPFGELSLPKEYTQNSAKETPFCADRFGAKYLTDLQQHSHEYCERSSISDLRCFHSQTSLGRTDSLCLGRLAIFDSRERKFILQCKISNPGQQVSHRIPDFDQFGSYWYETGPKIIFRDHVELHDPSSTPGRVALPESREFFVLLKREGEGNLWHCLMEIISLTLSVDVLRLSQNLETGMPLLVVDDEERTQVVILDDHPDGPYLDLWKLFAKRPILRLSALGNTTLSSNIIVPLAGGGSPFWQGDWEVLPCRHSSILGTFVGRVITFYGIETIALPQGDIVVTFINRVEKRQLKDQDHLIDVVKAQVDHVKIQVVDLAAISFKEQIRLIRNSDVLIGVHGAGLTHGLWLRPGSVMAEILPESVNHKGFRNLAGMLNHQYFSAHADTKVDKRDWHAEDVYIRQERFVELVDTAVKSVYNRGSRSFDVV